MNVVELMHRYTLGGVRFNPIKQGMSAVLKGLNVAGFLVGHFIARDMNLHRLSRVDRSVKKQTVTCMESVKRAPHQTTAEAGFAFHVPCFRRRDMMSSHAVEKRRL